MKKAFLLLIFLTSILGCTQNPNNKFDIQSFNLTNLSQTSNSEYEILRITNNQVILNELDTLNNPFLFTTRSIVILDQNGKQKKTYTIITNKRIIDFIEYKDTLYYFNLIEKNEKFYIELCKLENSKEKIIKIYSIDDPYAYPKFIQFHDQFYYKLNNSLFNLDTPNNPLDLGNTFFFSKNDIENNSVYLKISKNPDYQLYTLKDNKPKALNFQGNFGNFLVVNDSIIFQKNDNQYLYLHDLNNDKEICLFDQEQVSDFALLKNSIVVVNTKNSIYFIDMKENKIIDSIDKKEKLLENTIDWIYSNGIDQIYLIDNKNIYKIELNL